MEKIPALVKNAYARLGHWSSINTLNMGLINKTYVLKTTNGQYILQEVSPIFDVTIHDDSEAISHHLADKGVRAPSLVPTDSGGLYVREEGRIFRVLTMIEGKSYHKVQSLKMAEQAGFMIGRFHKAVVDLNYVYKSMRRHGGDYVFHVCNLKTALKAHKEHDYFAQVSPLALQMIEEIEELTNNLFTTSRHVHGDPKISNILFNEQDEAICLVDFDTLSQTGWSLELGDALRSWCNPNEEDQLSAYVDLSIAEKALSGYGQQMRGMLSEKELLELVIHAPAITLCLSIRYLTDVLNEKYWVYDSSRFERPAPHNWLRAQAMYQLYADFMRHKTVLKDLVYSFLK
ncbi:MAG TPA: phosphotransferase [Myxococcota bacterium]|nr:phosphotransferase [Myxococcota bacterium]